MKRSTSVTVAAALLIAGGIFLAFGSVMGVLGQFLQRSMQLPLPETQGTPQMPLLAMLIGAGVELLFGAWAIVTGIGVIRLRKWGWISMLVISGLTVLTFALGLFGVLMVIPEMKSASLPEIPAGFNAVLVVFMLLLMAVPLTCGIWWLIIFSLGSTRAQFRIGRFAFAGGSSEIEASSALRPMPVAMIDLPKTATLARPKIPTSILVIAIVLVAGAGIGATGLPYLLYFHFPNMMFGVLLTGWKAVASLVVFMTVQTLVGIALLRRKFLALHLSVLLIVLMFANAVSFSVSPARKAFFEEVFRRFAIPGDFNLGPFVHLMSVFMGVSLVFNAALALTAVYFLVTQRAAYRAACVASDTRAAASR
jgi:hypothetical protein